MSKVLSAQNFQTIILCQSTMVFIDEMGDKSNLNFFFKMIPGVFNLYIYIYIYIYILLPATSFDCQLAPLSYIHFPLKLGLNMEIRLTCKFLCIASLIFDISKKIKIM